MLSARFCGNGGPSWGEVADETPLAKLASERESSLRFWATFRVGGSGEASGDSAAAVIVGWWAREE